jgi:D-alanyl-D-alanine carboxypeptidase/D-alanyl-D-alanine-endopeptidase (penicillin-binding protein 4)
MSVFKNSLFVCCLFLSSLAAAQITPALKVFTQKENLSHARISFKAVDLTTGKTVAAYHENESLTPASTMKLVTTATAVEVLGADFRYETAVFYDGVIHNSILDGDLYIQGSGDPTLGSEFIDENKEKFLNDWAEAIQKAGITSITGDVIAVDSLFAYPGVSLRWMWEDLGNQYASGIYGISIFDNAYRVYLQSAASGTKATITRIDPPLPTLHFTNDIIAEGTSDNSLVSGIPFSNERRLYGTIPPNRTSLTLKGDIPDPGLFLAQYVVSYLKKRGIEVQGNATTYRLSPKTAKQKNELAVASSPYLASIIRVTNMRSNNHYAEHLYQTLLVKKVDISAYWERKGLDTSALFMYDGSGLSPMDAVSATFLTDLLIYMDKKDGKSGAFYHSFPVVGKEGTVVSFLKDTPLAGKARLKTGSIMNVQAYAGYIEKGDKRYAIAIIVNNFTDNRAKLRKDIEQLFLGL